MGIEVPAPVRSALVAALHGAEGDLDGLRRTDPAGWHVTLAFVGPLPDDRVPALRDAVAAAVAGRPPEGGSPAAAGAAAAAGAGAFGTAAAGRLPAQLTIDGAGRFGSQVLFYALTDEPAGALARLGERIQLAIERSGLPVDRRAVRPHLTVARGRRSRPVTDDDVRALRATVSGQPPVRWRTEAVALYRAVDRDGPARYEVEVSVPLSGG